MSEEGLIFLLTFPKASYDEQAEESFVTMSSDYSHIALGREYWMRYSLKTAEFSHSPRLYLLGF